MKVKIGDLTVSQVKGVCNRNFPHCEKCQLAMYGNECFVVASCSTSAFSTALDYELDTEIDLPDEGDKKGGLCPYPNCHYKVGKFMDLLTKNYYAVLFRNDYDRCIGCESRHKETDKFDSIVNDLKNGVQPQIGTNSKLPEGWREV